MFHSMISRALTCTIPSLAVSLCIIGGTPSVFGQVDRGTIEGVVRDPGGSEVAGVQIVITEQESGFRVTLVSDENGRYRASRLPVGIYRVLGTRPLYKKAQAPDLMLRPAQVLTIDLVLDLEEMSEVVAVPGETSLPIGLSARFGRSCYVDADNGNDENDGYSPENAWKTLEKVNSQIFGPGDKIFFKAGGRFVGQFKPEGSGAEGSPILVDRYGRGEKPLIAAGGNFGEALLLENQDYWEVSNLQLTNTGSTRELFRNGVRVLVKNYGTMRHIHLKGLWVHDVNGSLKKGKGEGYGILLETGGEEERSRFDGLLIEGCRLVRTDRNGICGLSSYRPNDARAFPSLNVVIRRNRLEDIGGDGIKIWGCRGALVEHNVIRGARTRCDDYAAGIWPWASDGTVIQFNEVSGVKGKKDGQAFDSDAHTTNTLFQYNYSHDNEGGFMLICCFDNIGTVIRYNISQNDQTRIFHMAGSNEDIQIYNNVFYVGEGLDVHLFLWTGKETNWTRNVEIFNNIFYVDGVGRNSSGQKRKPIADGTYIAEPGFGGSTDLSFERNFFFGDFEDIPEEWRQMSADPLLVAPGTAGFGFETTGGYQLEKESSATAAGRRIENNGGRDFWGGPLPVKKDPSIGVHEPR